MKGGWTPQGAIQQSIGLIGKALVAVLLCLSCNFGYAQTLAPRAYIITPIHANAVTLSYSFSDGTVLFDDAVPLTDSSARLHTAALSYFHTLNFLGRSANITAVLPYTIGRIQGNLQGVKEQAYRSGLGGSAFRFSVNIKGGPAMSVKEFLSWKQKTLLGVSFAVVAPTGQYDPTRLINIGTNRWALKPELGLSRRFGKWILDGYGGVWFFTTNPEYFSNHQFSSGTNNLSQQPIGVMETHLSYDVKPRLWASLDANFWQGGRTIVNGLINATTLQKNSRVGITCSIPAGQHQSLKFGYSRGAYVRFGGNFQNVSFAWQFSWLGKPN
jgi:hypothetical protein